MHKFLHSQPYFSLIISLILTFHLSSPKTHAANLYTNIVYPQVTSVNTTTAKPGDTIMLYGKNFGTEGQLVCDGPYDPATQSFKESKLMTYKTVIGAYMQPKSPTSGIPDYRLTIQSVTPDTIVAQIPSNMANGTYVIGYNAEFPKGICSGFGEILVGFARYDPLTITGGTSVPVQAVNPSTTTQKPTVQPTTKPKVTVTPTITSSKEASKSSETASKQTSTSSKNTMQTKFTSFISSILKFFGLRK